MANRLRGRFGYPAGEPFAVTTHPDRLEKPLRWRKPRRIFVDSMGDLFHDDVPDDFVAEVFGVMAVAHGEFFCGKETRRREPPSKQWPNGVTRVSMPKTRYGPHTFMVLTKRLQRALKLLTSTAFRGLVAAAAYRHAHNRTDAGHLSHQIGVREEYGRCYEPGRLWPLPNVWLGVTTENQRMADSRIKTLLKIPAAVRFVSVEPMLSRVDLNELVMGGTLRMDALNKRFGPTTSGRPLQRPMEHGIDWVICGGENGPGARPMELQWARNLRDQCQAAGVPYFFKGAGRGIETPPDLDVQEFPEVRHG